MNSLLRSLPASTPAMLQVFSDSETLRRALSFEAELAAAQAECGVIDADAAERIANVCGDMRIETAALAAEAALAGTLAIPLVARLRAAAPGAPIHLGATSQDLADTVLATQMRDGAALIDASLRRTADALALLARSEADRYAVGRTLLQDALPIGLGLRFAQWMAGVDSARLRLKTEARRGCALQLGGAVGSRAGMSGNGAAVAAALSRRLGLADLGAPWHARRDPTAGVACALGIIVGALGKMARDVSLLSQNSVAETREPATPGRGGSSAMAHKRNPTACQIALAAAVRAPGLVASVLSAMPQELERGLGGWQSEAPVLADLFSLAAGAADAMAAVAEGLEIDVDHVAASLHALGQGVDAGESRGIVETMLAQKDVG